MLDFERLKRFYYSNKKMILDFGSPWAKFILLPVEDPRREHLKQILIIHPNIKKIINRLTDPLLGINSLSYFPADYRIYGSFYWGLRFLADIGLTGEELAIGSLIKHLQLQQIDDGQFIVRYHRKKQQTISLICMTAHLTYCLIRLGYGGSSTVNTAINFIVTTQRKDGGWHCDRLKQLGEIHDSAPSCAAANIHVIRLLGQYDKKYETLVTTAINQCSSVFKSTSPQPCIYDSEQAFNLNQLRYPPHFTGLDILNIVHSLSFFPDLMDDTDVETLLAIILNRWDGKHWLRPEKKIPDWSNFDFSKKSGYSEWITSLFIQAIKRIYFKN